MIPCDSKSPLVKYEYLCFFGAIALAMENLVIPMDRVHRVILGTPILGESTLKLIESAANITYVPVAVSQ